MAMDVLKPIVSLWRKWGGYLNHL